MAFDGIFTRAMAYELKKELSGGRIDRIYQPGISELVFHIRTESGSKKLYASSSANRSEIHITDSKIDNPATPSPFCMLMRKQLAGGKITNISQIGWERIIVMNVAVRDEMGYVTEKKLHFEIMGRHSNIVLTDTDGRITAVLKTVSLEQSEVRQLGNGMKYILPPPQDKKPINMADIEELSLADSSSEILNKILGISPAVAEELFCAKNIKFKIDYILSAIESPRPVVFLDECGHLHDFHIFDLSSKPGLIRTDFKTLSLAVSYFYEGRISSNRIRQKTTDLSNILAGLIKKLRLKLQRLREDLREAENCEEFRLYGELLTANLHAVKKGSSEVSLLNYYTGKDVSIKLDPMLSPAQNAQYYYKKYNKSKTAIVEKNIQINIANEELNYLSSVQYHLNRVVSTEEIDMLKLELMENGYIKNRYRNKKNSSKRKQKNIFSPRRHFTSNGLKILVGRNNKENDELTMRKAGKNDFWFHTKDIPGSHVILFVEHMLPKEEDILEAASIAAHYSSARNSENVPVDYTKVKFVKKPNGAKPGKVIFTNNKTVYVKPFSQ